MFSAMQAMAKITTSVAVVSVSPTSGSTTGSTARDASATANGQYFSRDRIRLLELLDAFAEQAARPEHENQHHQQVHRGFARGRLEIDCQPAYNADQQRGRDHAPERAEPADDHHHEGRGEDLLSHRRM